MTMDAYGEIARSMRQAQTGREMNDEPAAKRRRRSDDKAAILARMNKQFSVVRIGSDTKVMRLAPLPGRPDALVPVYSSFRAFRDFHDRERVTVEKTNKKGEVAEERIGLGTWWLHQEARSQYEEVMFDPGAPHDPNKFNLWRGFAVKSARGDCSLYLSHIREIVCGGNEMYAEYFIRWLAFVVQNPGVRPEVAIVMRGGEGWGKGTVVKYFGALFGAHYMQVSQPGHLVGNFNSHLSMVKVLFADEALFAGDRRHEGVLKAIITEPQIMIEPKGVDAHAIRNVIAIIMSSNNDYVVPAGANARRFFVLDVLSSKQGDFSYFEAIEEQMERGGLAALLHYLLNYDMADFNIRAVPQTEALAEQKVYTRRDLDALVEMLAHEGRLPAWVSGAEDTVVTTGEARGEGFYVIARRMVPSLKHMSSIVIKRRLIKKWGCRDYRDNTVRGITFPALTELRDRFDAKHGRQEWPPDSDAAGNAALWNAAE